MEQIVLPIIRGESESSYPSVCRVSLKSVYGAEYTCTGTLISPNLVLCAAHCVDAPRIFTAKCIFDQGLEVPAQRWFWSKDFLQERIETNTTEFLRLKSVGFDFTILQLRRPILNIEPSPMMRLSDFKTLVRSGKVKEITAVGFGRFSKDEVKNLLAGVEKRSATFTNFSFPAGTQTLKVYPHQTRVGEPVSIAVGDSGGPYFANFSGVNYIVATVSTVTYANDGSGNADFATALGMDAPIDFFEDTLLDGYTQRSGKLGYGYVPPSQERRYRKNLENTTFDENRCLTSFCFQERPFLFSATTILPLASCVWLGLKIHNS